MLSRIEKLIAENGMTSKKFAETLGVSVSKITDWRSGKTKPTVNDIIGISQNFNVSADYLLTGKESNSANLTENEEEMLALFSQLSNREQLKEILRLEGYIKENKKTNNRKIVRFVAKGGEGVQVVETTASEEEIKEAIKRLKEKNILKD